MLHVLSFIQASEGGGMSLQRKISSKKQKGFTYRRLSLPSVLMNGDPASRTPKTDNVVLYQHNKHFRCKNMCGHLHSKTSQLLPAISCLCCHGGSMKS